MRRYSKEFKESVIRKMTPPENVPIARLAEETGVTAVTLYKWRNEVRKSGTAAPGNGSNSEKWSPEDKFLLVLETHGLNETELGKFCRSRGLYTEEVETWREACIQANGGQIGKTTRDLQREIRTEKKKRRDLERELRRKEKALAETAALLTLRKKAQAIWGNKEDE